MPNKRGKRSYEPALTPARCDNSLLIDSGREPTIALVRQVLGREDAVSEEAVVHHASDTPLTTILISRVLRARDLNPGDLQSEVAVRDKVRALYREISLGRISEDVSPQDVKVTLQLLAALGPVHLDDRTSLERLESFLGWDDDRLFAALDAIDRSGVLFRRGWRSCIAPDILRQSIMLEACVIGGRVSSFPDRLLHHVGLEEPHLVRNVALADLESRVDGGPELFPPFWTGTVAMLRATYSMNRAHFIEQLDDVAFLKPDETFELIEHLLANPATNDDEQPYRDVVVVGQESVVYEIPHLLKNVMQGSRALVSPCVALLWKLGKDDEYRFRHDTPVRTVSNLTDYDFGVGIGLATAIVDAVAGLINAGEADTEKHSLLEMIEPVLSRTVSSAISRGAAMEMRYGPLPAGFARPLRDRVIGIFAAAVVGLDDGRAVTAIKALTRLFRDPDYLRTEPTAEMIAAWDRERALAFDAFDAVVSADAWPVRELLIAHEVRFYADHGHSELTRQRAAALLERIGSTREGNRYRALIPGISKDLDFVNVHREDPSLGTGRRDLFLRQVADDFAESFPDPAVLLDDLARRRTVVQASRLDGTPHLIFFWLLEAHSTYGEHVAEAIVSRRDARFYGELDTFVRHALHSDPTAGEALARQVLALNDPVATTSVARGLWFRTTPTVADETVRGRIFRELLQHRDVGVRQAASHSFFVFARDYRHQALPVALNAEVGSDSQIAENIFMSLSPNDVEDDALRLLLDKLVTVPELGHWVRGFLEQIGPTSSRLVLGLLERRIFDGPDDHEYKAVPMLPSESESMISAMMRSPTFPDDFIEMLRRSVRETSICRQDAIQRLFAAVARADGDLAKRMVVTALESGQADLQLGAVRWLRHVPADLLTGDVRYVVSVLETAHKISDTCGDYLQGSLTCALLTGAVAVAPYERSPRDEQLDRFATEALETQALSARVKRFLVGLQQHGRGGSVRARRDFEDILGPE